MLRHLSSRRNVPAALAALLALSLASYATAQPSAAPHGRGGPPVAHIGPRQNQEHLAQWMDRHRSLPLPDQQRALEGEPGFRDLSPQVQQRMRERLTQLNNMPQAQRQRVLERAEVMEHLSPPQRQQVRGAMLQLSSLPEDRRRVVARAFRDLRETPAAQRESLLSSDRYRRQFSDAERSTLSSLIAVEPYLPPPHSAESTPQKRYPSAP
jgi:hypothetical protein